MQVSQRRNFNLVCQVLLDKEMKHSQPIFPQLNNFDCNSKNLCQRLSEKGSENDFQKGDNQTVLCGLLKIFYPMTILAASGPWHQPSTLAISQEPSACGIPSPIQCVFISSRRNKLQIEILQPKEPVASELKATNVGK